MALLRLAGLLLVRVVVLALVLGLGFAVGACAASTFEDSVLSSRSISGR